jgi:SSS family solute:Na+ symporter
MALTPLDWAIVLAVFAYLLYTLFLGRAQMRGVTDFLAAGRSAGRYLIAVSVGVAGLGAITIVGNFEMNLLAGFSMSWWGLTMSIVILLAAVFGWVIYRFRQTRCLTLAQFFEERYSRRFRIFMGLLAFLAGIVNMGIFPAVEARFFIHYCGLPPTVSLLGISLSTFALIMLFLIGFALSFVFAGGHVSVMITDFLQGVFVNLALIAIVLYLALTIDWGLIEQALQAAPKDASLINPYHTSQIRDFNFWYFLIGVIGFLYAAMSWQGTQAYNTSAKSAHEAKMGGVLSLWRAMPQTIALAFIPIVAYAVLNHEHFASIAASVVNRLPVAETDAVRSQLKVPLVLQQLLPRGLLGLFAAVMLCASISTTSAYLHSWGSIFVQDVLLPLRGRPLPPRRHLLALRTSALCVALFIFAFSLLFRQTQHIFLFFALTGAIFAGGSGAVIIGGLYWRRGTTAAAWAAMIVGASISVFGVVIHEIHEGFFINGQEFWAISMGASLLIFALVSLVWRPRSFDLDRLLHRGTHAVREDIVVGDAIPERGWKILGITREFTRGDRFIYVANYAWSIGWFLVFVIGTIHNLRHDVADHSWMRFWKIYLGIHISLAVVSFVWFTTGGMLDLRELIRRLRTRVRDETDDGFVRQRADAGVDEVTDG